MWNKQIFKQHFIRKTQVLFGCFFKISKWISYQVETFFESCKSSTILDTFRHRRHLKITGNRWITLIELFVLCVFFSRLVYFFLCQICEGFNLARGFIWESIQFFWFVVWPAMNYNSLITTGVASCWSCGPSHAHVGAPYCLLWAGVFFKSDFSFFYKEGIPIWKKEKKTIFGGGKEMEETTKLVLMHPTNVTKTKQQKRKKKEEYRSSNDNCLIIPSYPIRSMRFLNVLYYLPKKKLD